MEEVSYRLLEAVGGTRDGYGTRKGHALILGVVVEINRYISPLQLMWSIIPRRGTYLIDNEGKRKMGWRRDRRSSKTPVAAVRET